MIRNIETVGPEGLKAGIVIVGSGAAGLALAMRLEDRGLDSVVLEAGNETVSTAAQDFYRAAQITPDAHGPVHLYRRRGFGGTTAIWGGRCIPFDPIDFEDRPWIPHGRWPIAYEDVAPYYEDALTLAQAGPAVFNAGEALPGGQAPMVEGVKSLDLILDRIERFSEPTHFGKRYRERLDASQRITILTDAGVTGVTTQENGAAATGVTVRTPTGRDVAIEARTVIVAAGGLETPRLLLASREGRGVGNDRDLVGRFYQVHLEGEVGEIQFKVPPKQVKMDYQRSPEGVYCRRYIWISPDAQRREQIGGLILRPNHPTITDPDHRRSVLSAMYLVKDFILPEYGRRLTSTERQVKQKFEGRHMALMGGHLRNIILGSPELAVFAAKWITGRNLAQRKIPSVVLPDARNRYPIDVNAEQTPNADSRITLSDELDGAGVPRLKVQWRTREDDYVMLERGLRIAQRAMNASETAELVFEEEQLPEQVAACSLVGGHHIGTARMASDASEGVVDKDCQVFGVNGLYVAGAAVLPTSGFANPTLMLVSLALRLGDHLAAERT